MQRTLKGSERPTLTVALHLTALEQKPVSKQGSTIECLM